MYNYFVIIRRTAYLNLFYVCTIDFKDQLLAKMTNMKPFKNILKNQRLVGVENEVAGT